MLEMKMMSSRSESAESVQVGFVKPTAIVAWEAEFWSAVCVSLGEGFISLEMEWRRKVTVE